MITALVTDPAWGTGIWFVAAIPVLMMVVAGLQQLALTLAERRGAPRAPEPHDRRHVMARPGCPECEHRFASQTQARS